MLRRSLALLSTFALAAVIASAQGLNTNATKDDWEEINFETGSAILTDGYPSLLRLAELLAKNNGYRVKIEGHTDSVGSKRSNEKLGMARANTVKQFLEKYGANPSQISVATFGKDSPKVDNGSKEGRWMNRRATLTVTDPSGKLVSAAGVGDAIRNLNSATGGPASAADPKCCDEILKRLDKLDDILALLRNLKGENDALRKDVDNLKAAVGQQAANTPKPEEIASAASTAAAKATEDALAKMQTKKFTLLGLNAGPDSMGRLTFSGKGRYFSPFNNSTALQAEGEYMYFRDRQEGQFDLGLVNRYKSVQMGLFSSFKHVNISEYQNGGTLGQGAATFDYVFSRGRVGIFGTKGFLNNAVVNRANISRNIILENYLRIVDQVGGSTAFALWKDSYVEGNLGYLRTYAGSKPGMTVRYVHPLNSHIALSVEGGINETLITKDNSGSVRFGILFGGWLRPKNYGDHAGPVPVDIPRVRYEVLSRKIRTGNDAPVADAGPDQINVPSGTISLDGSGSYDPDGDPMTYQWTQIAGPAVSLSSPTTATASFTAADNQTYAFRLTVKDDQGGQGVARVTITTRANAAVRIVRYEASPNTIKGGEKSTLLWSVENADSVEIEGLGKVDPRQGTSDVTPTATRSYKLTAKNATSEASSVVTITVTAPQVRILTFNASPATIQRGQSSTLAWQTENATEVNIAGIGNLPVNGTTSVSPTETTTYTITAKNNITGATVSATATVQVGAGGGGSNLPRIIRFTASPMDINVGANSTVDWLVENADTVNISTLGTVGLSGSAPVSPTANTIYTLTATNSYGSISSTVGINVHAAPAQPPTISACVANPSTVAKAGDPSNLSFTTQNARVVTLNGLGISNPVTVNPLVTTTYTLIAWGVDNKTAQCQVTVTVPTNPNPVTPVADPGPDLTTMYRELTLDGSNSRDPEGLPLTYRWSIVDKTASILDPNSAKTRVQLGTLAGIYIFNLTVTNSKGVSSTSQVRVNFVKATLP